MYCIQGVVMLVKGLYNTDTGSLTAQNINYEAEKLSKPQCILWCHTCGVSPQTVVKTCHRGCGVRTGVVLAGAGAVCEILPVV
jgi:hypothetical protein